MSLSSVAYKGVRKVRKCCSWGWDHGLLKGVKIKLPTSAGSWKKQEFQKSIYFCFIDYAKALTVWITTNCGKFLKRWEYQTTWAASWEICMQIKEQQLELDMEQQTGSKQEKEYAKAVYCHPAYLTSMQSTSWETLDWKRSVFIPIPKKGNAKECSNYCTVAVISHASKVVLKILQASLQQYMNHELPDIQAGFRKGRGTRDQIANIHWIIKARDLLLLYWLH